MGPAATHGRIDRQASAVALQPTPGFATAAVTYPAPARTLTPNECITGLGTDKKFFIKSRYAACSGAVFFSVWLRNNRPVGETQFVYLSIGTIAKDSRAVRMTQYFTEMKKTGSVATSGLMITPKVKVPKVWPSTARVTQTGAVPGARSFAALAAQQSVGFTRTLNATAGQGTGRDDAIASVFEASATVTPPPGYRPSGELSGSLFFLPPRWDKASYLKVPAGAAVFTYVIPLHYSSRAGAPERAVAEHLKTTVADALGPAARHSAVWSVRGGGRRSAVVLDPHRWLELRCFRSLLESGAISLSEVARETGLDRKTVRKYLSAPGPATPPRRSPNGRSKARVIDEFAPLVDSMLRAEILMKAAVIHGRLVAEYGFTGNYQRTKLCVHQPRWHEAVQRRQESAWAECCRRTRERGPGKIFVKRGCATVRR
ncbi:hypothetical protein QFZ82_007764 [Streptomyces sp. V4I23]|nr:hypothetical protein [Streptomyces sp. V4I23]